MRILTGWVLALALSVPASAGEQVILVLDASGSMWGQIDGRSKVEIAREAVAGLVSDWQPENDLGLVTYGHRSRGDCDDIEVILEPGPLDQATFLARVNALNARGMTPLSAAVIRAAEVLRHTERKATVILVSDGEETCNMDPCAVGAELDRYGIDFTAHVIGFDVEDEVHQEQLRCLAENTGGRYFNAGDAAELANALGTLAAVTTAPALPPATASLSAPLTAPMAAEVEVAWEGPDNEGDYIALSDGERELSYAWTRDSAGRVRLRTANRPGDYMLRYVSPRRSVSVLAERAIAMVEAAASIEAPAEVGAGSLVSVIARGPKSTRHWVGFARAGADPGSHLAYSWVQADSDVYALAAPNEPGDYEVRYILVGEDSSVAARQAVRVVEAEASVSAPAEVMAGNQVEVEASGPTDLQHWIGFAPAGAPAERHLAYAYAHADTSTYRLEAPLEPGDYEVRYVLSGNVTTVAAAQAVRVTAAEATIEAAASGRAGDPFVFSARGPDSSSHWIALARSGSADDEYLNYVHVIGADAEYRFTLPQEAGDYELRFILNNQTVVARRTLRVE